MSRWTWSRRSTTTGLSSGDDISLASRPAAESWTYALRFADYGVTGARSSIMWASGAEPASVSAGRTGGGGLPGGALAAMISAYRRGQLTLDGLGLEFRARRWPEVPSVCPPGLDQASAAIDDLEPYVPGSFDDVVLAYDQGLLSDEEYDFLAGSAA